MLHSLANLATPFSVGCLRNACEFQWPVRSKVARCGLIQATPRSPSFIETTQNYIRPRRAASQLLISCLTTRYERANRDLRKGHPLWWHTPTECTIACDVGCAGQVFLSPLQLSWRWASPACWQTPEALHRASHPHSASYSTPLSH